MTTWIQKTLTLLLLIVSANACVSTTQRSWDPESPIELSTFLSQDLVGEDAEIERANGLSRGRFLAIDTENQELMFLTNANAFAGGDSLQIRFQDVLSIDASKTTANEVPITIAVVVLAFTVWVFRGFEYPKVS